MLKPQAVHIQAQMHPYRPKTGLKISCDSPFKAPVQSDLQTAQEVAMTIATIINIRTLVILKGSLTRFLSSSFSSEDPIYGLCSYPNAISNLTSNSPRYSNWISFYTVGHSTESLFFEAIQCFKLGWYGPWQCNFILYMHMYTPLTWQDLNEVHVTLK